MSQKKPIGGSRFIVASSPGGFGTKLFASEGGYITGFVTLDQSKEGPPGHAHGGSLAALIDEIMGASAWNQGLTVLAANININFKQPVPLHVEISLAGWVERVDGRKVYTAGKIMLPDETIAVEGTGLFIVSPGLFEKVDGYNPFQQEWRKENTE